MRLAPPMTCSALLMCMAVSSAAWAQDGFLVFPAKDKKNATEVVAASCKYNFDKGGTQSVQCTLYAPAAPKDYSINAKETIPQPLVFVTPTAGCICYWGPNGYVCVPPSCR